MGSHFALPTPPKLLEELYLTFIAKSQSHLIILHLLLYILIVLIIGIFHDIIETSRNSQSEKNVKTKRNKRRQPQTRKHSGTQHLKLKLGQHKLSK